MSVIRAFIAIELPEGLRIPLQELSSRLQRGLAGKSIRWLPIENMHLTLKFLKNLALADIELLSNALQPALADVYPFELELKELGLFPSHQRPQVIRLGIESHPDLIRLQQHIERETARLGYPAERRPFSPHLTLGRVRRNVPSTEWTEISQSIDDEKPSFVGRIRVKEAVLFRSELRSSGALYTKFSTVRLGNPNKEPQLI